MSKEQIEYIVLGLLESACSDAVMLGDKRIIRKDHDALLDRMWALTRAEPKILSWPVLVRAGDTIFDGAVN